MSLSSALAIAGGGLANLQRQFALVSHNIANAGTDGYVRQRAAPSTLTADGIGLGVRPGVALRDVDLYLRGALLGQGAEVAGFARQGQALAAIDAVHGTPGAGNDLAALLNAMRDAFSGLATDPADQAQQRRVVSAAETLAHAINDLARTIQAQRQEAQDGIVADIARLNEGLGRIGDLTARIIALKSAGASTADLENERDGAVRELGALLPVKALERDNGDMLLVTDTGVSLPIRGEGPALTAAPATTGAAAWYPGGGIGGIMLNNVDVTAQLRGGRIGANIALRDETLPRFLAELDEFAFQLAGRFDAQGLSLFTDPAGAVPAGGGAPAQAGYVGFSLIVQVNPAVRLDAALVRDGTHAVAYNPAGASAFTPNPPGGPAGFLTLIQRVLDFALGEEAQPGVAQAAPNAVGLGPAGTLAAPYAGAMALPALARALVSAQAAEAGAAALRAETAQAVQADLAARYASATGVDIDAEMTLMLQLQTAYGANARIVSAVQDMWDTLLAAVR